MEKSKYKFCIRCAGELEQKSPSQYECRKCHYKQYRNPKPGVCVLIADNEGRVLLTKRRGTARSGFWGLPGGFLEANEGPIEAAKRETKEEIGVEIELEKVLCFEIENDLYDEIEGVYGLNIGFLAKITSGEPRPLDENSEVRFFTKEEIPWDLIAFPGNTAALKVYFGIKKPYLPA